MRELLLVSYGYGYVTIKTLLKLLKLVLTKITNMINNFLQILFAPEYRIFWLWGGGIMLWLLIFAIGVLRSIGRAIENPEEYNHY